MNVPSTAAHFEYKFLRSIGLIRLSFFLTRHQKLSFICVLEVHDINLRFKNIHIHKNGESHLSVCIYNTILHWNREITFTINCYAFTISLFYVQWLLPFMPISTTVNGHNEIESWTVVYSPRRPRPYGCLDESSR